MNFNNKLVNSASNIDLIPIPMPAKSTAIKIDDENTKDEQHLEIDLQGFLLKESTEQDR